MGAETMVYVCGYHIMKFKQNYKCLFPGILESVRNCLPRDIDIFYSDNEQFKVIIYMKLKVTIIHAMQNNRHQMLQ